MSSVVVLNVGRALHHAPQLLANARVYAACVKYSHDEGLGAADRCGKNEAHEYQPLGLPKCR